MTESACPDVRDLLTIQFLVILSVVVDSCGKRLYFGRRWWVGGWWFAFRFYLIYIYLLQEISVAIRSNESPETLKERSQKQGKSCNKKAKVAKNSHRSGFHKIAKLQKGNVRKSNKKGHGCKTYQTVPFKNSGFRTIPEIGKVRKKIRMYQTRS